MANCTWAEIDAIAQAGVAGEVFSVGDTKDLSVFWETVTMEIIGFNHDDLTSGGKAGITFGMKHLMDSPARMNETDSNAGSFIESEMHSWLNINIFNEFPDDLQAAIKAVNKLTSSGGGSSAINADEMKLFLFSASEIFGSSGTGWATPGEGTQYARFSNTASRIKKLGNGIGENSSWWERSPAANGSTSFCYVSMTGVMDSGSVDMASSNRGVCFGFCI